MDMLMGVSICLDGDTKFYSASPNKLVHIANSGQSVYLHSEPTDLHRLADFIKTHVPQTATVPTADTTDPAELLNEAKES